MTATAYQRPPQAVARVIECRAVRRTVDAAVYEWPAGGAYGIDGTRGKQRLAYPEVDPSARTKAHRFLAEARKYAGPSGDRSHVRISALRSAPFRVEQARPEA